MARMTPSPNGELQNYVSGQRKTNRQSAIIRIIREFTTCYGHQARDTEKRRMRTHLLPPLRPMRCSMPRAVVAAIESAIAVFIFLFFARQPLKPRHWHV